MGADVSEESPGPLFDDEVAATERSRAELEEIMGRADTDPRAFHALLARLETDPTRGFARVPPGGCSTGPAKNAAARRCEPPPQKTRTSKSAGSPATLSGSQAEGRPPGRPRRPGLTRSTPLAPERLISVPTLRSRRWPGDSAVPVRDSRKAAKPHESSEGHLG